jgi:DMSO reductase family type II enzyme chaperone
MTQQQRDDALCRSVLYGALSLALHYPTAETCDKLLSPDAAPALRQAASILSARRPHGSAPADGLQRDFSSDLVRRIDDWIATFQSLKRDRLLVTYGRLFGHTARSPVCPYETEYGQEALFQQPRQLAEIRGFYEAFGLTPHRQERERADHASCELEFLDFLSRKEGFAIESIDKAMLEETRKAIRLFLRDHLGRFGLAFARTLGEQDPGGFFGKLGDLLHEFVVLECRRLDLEPGPCVLHLRSAEEDKVPMACGEAPEPELVQLETPE